MNFTFGIVTNFSFEPLLLNLISSIEKQQISNYEILLVGCIEDANNYDSYVNNRSIQIIEFDETIKNGWITKKKNLIVKNAKFENIVFLHDYLELGDDWYEGYLKFGDEFEVVTNKILNKDLTRFRDWTISPQNYDKISQNLHKNSEFLLPYEEINLTKLMYISGAYWVAKKNVMLEFPLNENLCWGEGEDIEWSHRVREKYVFKLNLHSSTKLQKQKKIDINLISKNNLFLLTKNESQKLLKLSNKALFRLRRFKHRSKNYRKIKYYLSKLINIFED